MESVVPIPRTRKSRTNCKIITSLELIRQLSSQGTKRHELKGKPGFSNTGTGHEHALPVVESVRRERGGCQEHTSG